MVIYFLHMYEYRTLKPVRVILIRGIMEGMNQTRVHMYKYMEMLHHHLLYNYYILIRNVKKRVL
jgi:hypothetical protein